MGRLIRSPSTLWRDVLRCPGTRVRYSEELSVCLLDTANLRGTPGVQIHVAEVTYLPIDNLERSQSEPSTPARRRADYTLLHCLSAEKSHRYSVRDNARRSSQTVVGQERRSEAAQRQESDRSDAKDEEHR